MGKSDYIKGESVKSSFRLNPKPEMADTNTAVATPVHMEDAPDAPTEVKNQEITTPAIDIPETKKPKARHSKKPKEAPLVNGQKQVTQTTTEKYIAPANGNGNGHAATIEPPPHPAEVLINSKINDDQYEVQIYNTYDASIHSAPKTTVADIRAFIRSRFGNGSYRLKVLRNGVPIETDAGYLSMMITDAPKVERNTDSEVDVVVESKKKVQVKKAEVETARAEKELQDIKDQQEEERERRAKSKNATPEVAALQKQLEDLKALIEKKSEKTPSLGEQLKEWAPIIAVLAPILKPEPPEKENTTKLMLDLFQKMDEREDRRREAAERRDEKREEKFEKLIEKMEDGKNKNTLTDKLEEWKLMSEVFGKDKDDDDFDIDPERPIASAFAALIKVGAKGFAALAKDPATRQVMAHVAARLNKQPEDLGEGDMTAVTSELQQMQKYIAENPPQAALPAPAPIQMPKLVPLQPPVNLHGHSISGLKVQQNPAVAVEPVSAIPIRVGGESSASSAPLPAISGEQSIVPPPVAPVAQSETPKPTAETAPAELFEEPAISQADIEDDIKDSVTNTTRLMVLDIDFKRWDACKWWDSMAEWPREVVDEFCKPCDDFISGKLNVLKLYANEKVFNELLKRLASDSNQMNFNGSVMKFCTYRNEVVPVTQEAGA